MSDAAQRDERFMRRALALAARGRGYVEPNPMVGCVIVRGGRIIGEGWHRRFGGPHAEVDALRRCTASPRGATAYVTLEPCRHFGKTPPCTDALIAAGVARVVAAGRDPGRESGGGATVLRRAGVRTEIGLLGDAAAALNAPFYKLARERRPWVTLKWAQSLDGKIATRTGDSKWISDEAARAHAHRTRGRVDAILIGIETARRDDPILTCRSGRPRRVATRVVLDTRLRLPPTSRLVRSARDVPTWIFCGPRPSVAVRRRLEALGCRVTPVPVARGGLALGAVLDALGRESCTNLLVEGGGRVLGSFLDEGLADEVQVYIAPRLIGGVAAPGALGGHGPARLGEAARFVAPSIMRRLGDGWVVTGRLDRR